MFQELLSLSFFNIAKLFLGNPIGFQIIFLEAIIFWWSFLCWIVFVFAVFLFEIDRKECLDFFKFFGDISRYLNNFKYFLSHLRRWLWLFFIGYLRFFWLLFIFYYFLFGTRSILRFQSDLFSLNLLSFVILLQFYFLLSIEIQFNVLFNLQKLKFELMG